MEKCYGGTGDDIARSIYQDSDGNYVLTGSTTTSNNGDLTGLFTYGLQDYWVFKIDSAGTHNIIWQKLLGGSQGDFALCGAPALDGGILVCGRSFSIDFDIDTTQGGGDCWMAKLNAANPAGPLDWVRTIGGSLYDGANWIFQSSDSGVVVGAEGNSPDGDIAGHNFHPPTTTGEESFTFKFKDTASVTTSVHFANNSFNTITIYPNPFSTQTTLQAYHLLHNATLTVDNCFGQTVKQIKNISGQTVILSRDNLATGLYFVHLTQNNQVIATKKILITD